MRCTPFRPDSVRYSWQSGAMRSCKARLQPNSACTNVPFKRSLLEWSCTSGRSCDGPSIRTVDDAASTAHWRSEEHTSELQSLMRNSYAVFCLKKKTQKPKSRENHTTK